MVLKVVHRTEYDYESPVSASYGQLYLLLRNAPGQQVQSTRVDIEPPADSFGDFSDFFGNRGANFSVLRRHRSLTVTATSLVDTSGRRPPDSPLSSPSWEDGLEHLRTSDDPAVLAARQFTLASPAVPLSEAARRYALETFTPGRPLLDGVHELTTRIYNDIQYKPGATSLRTTPDEVLDVRKGVCQDFAHLQVACLRSLGLAARYVSGYLETVAPPGKVKLQGADASHAWLSLHVPNVGWVDVDPTNNCFAGERHVTTAWGRDYGDVSPLKGVIFTEAKSNVMTVSVDVSPAP